MTVPGGASGLYQRDCYAWAIKQAKALRERRIADLDFDNLAGEIDDVAWNESRILEEALTVLLAHLLQWDHRPTNRSRRWEATIHEQRLNVAGALKENPGLRQQLDDLVLNAYESARDRASGETDLHLSKVPAVNPYDWATMMERPIMLGRDLELVQERDR